MRRRVFPTLLAGTLLVSGLSGCSLIFGSNVSQSDLEDEVFKELTDQVGEEPD
ncbi:MAG TPA: hypothetical protein H9870_03535 [Candidatus Corynebacterium avicola]|uniref:Uncharacterized protein n=1 Tax=Candidatus Corynebacterium avicola TaxID=2838527 RepID=A0A9D1ULE4_9CORY|nr:hypothetical protein [Candidatus Corynebacterium avicola]